VRLPLYTALSQCENQDYAEKILIEGLFTGLRNCNSTWSRRPHGIGMDVHQATISVAVMDASGKLLMECLLETKASTIIEFIQGLQGTVSLTFEEGTSAAWLHDLLKSLTSTDWWSAIRERPPC
jgi:hypothetical protein